MLTLLEGEDDLGSLLLAEQFGQTHSTALHHGSRLDDVVDAVASHLFEDGFHVQVRISIWDPSTISLLTDKSTLKGSIFINEAILHV